MMSSEKAMSTEVLIRSNNVQTKVEKENQKKLPRFLNSTNIVIHKTQNTIIY